MKSLNDWRKENTDLNDKEEISDATYTRNYELIQEAKEEFEQLEQEPADIFEWYKVSSWFCEKLKEQGQPVIDNDNLWGRTCTGQAVLLDAVITSICANMGILEGQENEWRGLNNEKPTYLPPWMRYST